MSLQVGDGLEWVLIVHRTLQLGLPRPIIRDYRNHYEYGESIEHGSVEVAAVRRYEIEDLRQYRRNYDPQQKQKPDVRQAAINDKQDHYQFRQCPPARPQERTDQEDDEENDDEFPTRIMKIDRHPLVNMLDVELLTKG